MSKEEFNDFKPQNLLDGVTLDDLKSLPKVKALLEKVAAVEKAKAREDGIAEGRELGRVDAFQKFSAQYEKDFELMLKERESEFEDILKSLKKPLNGLEEKIIEAFSLFVEQCLKIVVRDERIYDQKIPDELAKLLDTLPQNNRIIKLQIKNDVPDSFKEMFKGYADVEVVEMDELVRVQTSAGDYLLDPVEVASEISNSLLR